MIKIKDISPLKEILLEREKSMIKMFIVAASKLKRILKRCLYCKERATKATINPSILAKIKGHVLISCNGSSS